MFFSPLTAAAANGVQSTPPLLAAWGRNPTFPTIHVYIKPGCSDELGMFRDPGRLNSSQGSPAQPQRGRGSGCILMLMMGKGCEFSAMWLPLSVGPGKMVRFKRRL